MEFQPNFVGISRHDRNVTGEMSGGQHRQIDEVNTGRAIWSDPNHRRKIIDSLEGNQCGCADLRSVFEIMKKQPQVP
jgi:hypothetical protein